jgi:hypothetical protein
VTGEYLVSISEQEYRQIVARLAPKDKPPLGPGPDRESELHDEILTHCRGKGWLCVHSRMDRKTTTARGVSDFIIVTPCNVYFVECKRPGQKLRPEQQAFAANIKRLGWPCATVHSLDEFLQFINAREIEKA